MIKKPLISIITVVYNDIENIEETILSVLSQTYDNIELIVIDGASNDGTAEVIKKYDKKIDYWISEKDGGIFDAMNKGIKVSKGDYINFMNSGDFFTSADLVNEVVKNLDNQRIDLLYGNRNSNDGNYSKINIKYHIQLTYQTICHQVIFANKNCFENNMFDLKYRWMCDYKWLLECFLRKAVKIKYIDKEICYVEPIPNAVTKSDRLKKLYERGEIGHKYFFNFKKILFDINQLRLVTKFRYFWKYR